MMLADATAARDGRQPEPEPVPDPSQSGPSQSGPSQSDMDAAAQLSPEQRTAMIEGMVARLDERLTRQGGSAEEWVRLIASYATLGRQDEARRAYDRALAALGDGPDARGHPRAGRPPRARRRRHRRARRPRLRPRPRPPRRRPARRKPTSPLPGRCRRRTAAR